MKVSINKTTTHPFLSILNRYRNENYSCAKLTLTNNAQILIVLNETRLLKLWMKPDDINIALSADNSPIVHADYKSVLKPINNTFNNYKDAVAKLYDNKYALDMPYSAYLYSLLDMMFIKGYNENHKKFYDISNPPKLKMFGNMLEIIDGNSGTSITINTSHVVSIEPFTPNNAVTDPQFIDALRKIESNTAARRIIIRKDQHESN